MEKHSLMNKIIFSFIFSKTKVLSFVTRFLLFFVVFRKLLSRLLLITFDLLKEILSLRYQNLSSSFLYTIKKIIFKEYILDVEKIFIKDLNFFVGHPVYKTDYCILTDLKN